MRTAAFIYGGAAAPPVCTQSKLLYNIFIGITRDSKYKKQKEMYLLLFFILKTYASGSLHTSIHSTAVAAADRREHGLKSFEAFVKINVYAVVYTERAHAADRVTDKREHLIG